MSFGEFNADDEGSNVLSYLDRKQLIYKKVVIRDNRVVGGLFFGDTSGGEQVLELARKRTYISAFRHNLLSGNLGERISTGKVLCSCVGVTREEIQAAIKRGMRKVEALQENLRVGVTCGTCLQDLRELVKAVNG
jgi:NAD(P)H-nitrite reductase